ncbi:hypothetical protein BDQ17DRAFT_1176114, partial [Cyathus striatus]
ALLAWREKSAIAKFGLDMVKTYGVQLLMPDKIVEHIIACGQAFKIELVSHFLKETRWLKELVLEFGAEILTVIH